MRMLLFVVIFGVQAWHLATPLALGTALATFLPYILSVLLDFES